MTALSGDRPPPLPTTVGGIRALLPLDQHSEFDAELERLDLADSPAVEKFLNRWWCLAALATDPNLLAGIDPDEPLYPSPLRPDAWFDTSRIEPLPPGLDEKPPMRGFLVDDPE